MKKFFTSAVFIIAFGAYAVNQYLGSSASASQTLATTQSVQTDPLATDVTSGQPAPTVNTAPIPTTTTPAAPVTTPATPVTPSKSGQYIDGTYTGSSANAYYGYVEVQATVSGGKLADVTFLSYPSDRRQSQEINNRAMPILQQEAIAAQSANVSGVSGATDTSMAFRQSLSSALAQAKNS